MDKHNPFRKWIITISIGTAIISTMLTELIIFLTYNVLKVVAYPEAYIVSATIPIFLINLIFSTIIFRRIFRSLNRLSVAMSKVADGQFDIRLNGKTADPLNGTYRNFNKMTKELANIQSMRNDFIGQFSHEFKTPISSINGFAELLLDEQLSKEKEKEYLNIIAAESARLSNLSKQIMKLTSLENTNVVTNQEKFDLSEQLRMSVISLFPHIQAKKLKYHIDIDQVYYQSDPALIKEVWINLLNNSIKFAPNSGNIYISCHQSKKYVTVTIGNDGEPINEQDKQKIFDKFYQGKSKNNNQGLGLGLTIVHKILNLIGGKIDIRTPETGGSFFDVSLPIK